MLLSKFIFLALCFVYASQGKSRAIFKSMSKARGPTSELYRALGSNYCRLRAGQLNN